MTPSLPLHAAPSGIVPSKTSVFPREKSGDDGSRRARSDRANDCGEHSVSKGCERERGSRRSLKTKSPERNSPGLGRIEFVGPQPSKPTRGQEHGESTSSSPAESNYKTKTAHAAIRRDQRPLPNV